MSQDLRRRRPGCELDRTGPSGPSRPAPAAAAFANADSRGYYFTDYTADTVGALREEPRESDGVERISLLGDEWWMVRAGRHDIDLYLDLAAAMAGDETPVITETIANRLAAIGSDIVDAAERARYQAWIRARFGPVLNALGLPGPAGDTDDRHGRRGTLLHLVGVTGNDPDVQRKARELAVQYIANPSSIPSTLAPTVLQVAAVGGDAALYERYRGAAAQDRRAAGAVLPLLQRAVVVLGSRRS